MRLLETQLRSPGPIVFAPSRNPGSAEQREAMIPVLWPRYREGYGVQMTPIDPARIPAGWTSIQVHVPMRLATCEETECPMFLRGWTEVLPADGTSHPMAGEMTSDQAAEIFGRYGAAQLAPKVLEHPAGTPCGRVHKVPSGVPPLYTIDGRPTLWNEFEDAIGGSVHRVQQINREGRY